MGHSILIVDDSATTRAYIKRTLQLAGIPVEKCHEAADGAAGLEVLKANPVDLVLADLHMPVMDGAEMARRILGDEALKHVPVLVVSADPNTQRLDQLREEGIAGYVRKPFTPERFAMQFGRFSEMHMTDFIQLDGLSIAESLAQGLETAFISVAPAEPPYGAPAEMTLVRIAFTGPVCGALEMLAPRGLGALLLSNVMGEDSASVSAAQADDALKEIMNVVCGSLLRGAPGARQFEISLPTVAVIGNDQAWSDFVSSDGAAVIDAEGNLIGVRVAPCS